jgi:hypothetical protein
LAAWSTHTLEKIAAADDLHIAVYHPDGKTTGTLTWIWSVIVDGRLFARAYNSPDGRWYRPAVTQRTGRITAAGHQHEVEFTPIDDPELGQRIDTAYSRKYAGSPYLPPMLGTGPNDATVEITPHPAR